MKIIVTAIALAFALPAAAQPAPAQHQGHDQHQPGQHQPGQHQPGQHQPGQHQPGQHEQHRDGCCADRDGNGRMDCCDRAEAQSEGQGCEHHHAGGDSDG